VSAPFILSLLQTESGFRLRFCALGKKVTFPHLIATLICHGNQMSDLLVWGSYTTDKRLHPAL